jgi:hypothetical protein
VEEEVGYRCLYLGSVNMGNSGDVHLIEMGINAILKQSPTGTVSLSSSTRSPQVSILFST